MTHLEFRLKTRKPLRHFHSERPQISNSTANLQRGFDFESPSFE